MTQRTSKVSTTQLIAIPAILTLAITVLRLVGELQHWSPKLFSPAAGGAFALVGIWWLPIVFGIYFAWKLADAGERPPVGPAIGYSLLALIIEFLGFFAVMGAVVFPGSRLVGLVLMIVGILVPMRGWRDLFKALIAYAYAARIPVVIVMYFAMQGNWGTHYDAVPPTFPGDLSLLSKWLQLGVVPQMFLWIAYTIVVGTIFGTVAVAVLHKDRSTRETKTASA